MASTILSLDKLRLISIRKIPYLFIVGYLLEHFEWSDVLYVVWALKKSTLSIKDFNVLYVVMLHELSHRVFCYCCTALSSSFSHITSSLSPIYSLHSWSFSSFSFDPHQQPPPCTSLLICLSSTDCPGLQWRAVLSPWLCCKYLIHTALHCCMSLAVWALHYVTKL